jgi:3-oxoacyl-[acyl-carrier-protein] synthase II
MPEYQGPQPLPPRVLHTVPDLRLADHLGRKGIRHIDRLTALGLVACKLALDGADGQASGDDRSQTGVVLGTSTGSSRSIAEVAHDSLTAELPYQVNPSQIPNTVMNACAGQLAIWNSLRGVNATVAAGALSSLYALRYARTVIGQGRATRLIAGGVEEVSVHTAWAWHRAGVLTDSAAVGEGCALFLIDGEAPLDDERVLAELLACEVRFCPAPSGADQLADGLSATILRALDRSGLDADDVSTVALGSVGLLGPAAMERRGVRQALGRSPRVLPVAEALGVSYSASTALQVASVLALWRRGGADLGDVALVTGVGIDGNLGCLVLRRPRRRADAR